MFWGQSRDALVTREQHARGCKISGPAQINDRDEDSNDARSFNFRRHQLRQEPRVETSKPVVQAPDLRRSGSLDDFLAVPGPQIDAGAWQASIGMDKLRNQQKQIRDFQSGIAQIKRDEVQNGYLQEHSSLLNKDLPASQTKDNNPQGGKVGDIDPQLLAEAFKFGQKPTYMINTASFTNGNHDYAQDLETMVTLTQRKSLRANLIASETVEQQPRTQARTTTLAPIISQRHISNAQRRTPSSFSSSSTGAASQTRRKGKKKVKKMKKSSTRSLRFEADSRSPFSTSPRRPEKDNSNNIKASRMQQELDAMIENFTSGTIIDDLRKQLEQSQRSLQSSQTFIESATSSWFRSS